MSGRNEKGGYGDGSLEVTPPEAFDLQNVRIDLRKFFVKLSEAAVHGGLAMAGKPDAAVKAATSMVGAAEALSLKTPPANLAWHLVRTALAKAMEELVEEWLSGRPIWKGDLENLKNRIDIKLTDDDVVIDRNFFENPATLKILPATQRNFVDWLRYIDLPTPEAQAMSKRLESYFSFALRTEWRAHRERYEPLREYFNDPFANAARIEEDWEQNRLALIREVDKPVFEETFSLAQVYIPLRGAIPLDKKGLDALSEEKFPRILLPPMPPLEPPLYQKKVPTEDPDLSRYYDDKVVVAVVVDLHQHVMRWLDGARKAENAIHLLTGGPGSGKSSFARSLAADLARNGQVRALFFPLQRFAIRDRLDKAIGDYLVRTEAFERNPLEQPSFASSDRRILMIFDGLDELAKPGKDADEETQRFIHELQVTLNQWNENGCRVLALVTGRTVTVQSIRDTLPESRQESIILRYWESEERKEKLRLYDIDDLLATDQREEWWARYAAAKAGEPAKRPAALCHKDLDELTAEPLLNYLVVLSGHHRQPSQEKQVNRNEIYRKLLVDVIERRHAGGKPLAVRQKVRDKAAFESLIETIAVAAWYGDGRTATVKEILHHCPECQKPYLNLFLEERGGRGLSRLVAAFYFRQAEGRSDLNSAFEFTHKTFGEYLTARRLVHQIRHIHDRLTKSPDHYRDEQAFAEWCDLCRFHALTFDLLRFLRDEIAMPEWHNDVAGWQRTLCRLFDRNLRIGMPLPSETTFREAELQARNAEETLLAAIDSCALITRQRSSITWPDDTSVGKLLHRLLGQRSSRGNVHVAIDCLRYLEIGAKQLFFQNLEGADLEGADLTGAILQRANLKGANLKGADLEGADLEGANLEGANLKGANLKGANLVDANFKGANLVDANFEDVIREPPGSMGFGNLDSTDFTGFDSFDFDNFNLNNVDFNEED